VNNLNPKFEFFYLVRAAKFAIVKKMDPLPIIVNGKKPPSPPFWGERRKVRGAIGVQLSVPLFRRSSIRCSR
jgi:hypothetical protein